MRTIFSSIALAFLVAFPAVAATSGDALPLLLKDFRLHDFDAAIPASMGYDGGSVIYLSELGSISDAELRMRNQYEPYGCFPFYFMKDGKITELGFNCRSFFCVGYQKGPKQCRDRENQVTGGVVEINRRLSAPIAAPARVLFSAFSAAQQTDEMKRVAADLAAIHCRPYYLMHFDIIVGQGYECDEVGKYPFYSSATACREDWRDNAGMQCTVPPRANERELRMQALHLRVDGTSVLSATDSSEGTGSSSSSSAPSPITFDDVLEGKYGYTAITALAANGVLQGYGDGTFRPMVTMTRGEFTKLLLSALHQSELQDETDCFRDVRDQWFSTPVCAAKRLGWVRGYGDGTFRPHRGMTMAEAMTLLMATLPDTDVSNATLPEGADETAWYAPAIRKAVALGILREPIFLPDRVMTRADAAVWMYRAGNSIAVSQR